MTLNYVLECLLKITGTIGLIAFVIFICYGLWKASRVL